VIHKPGTYFGLYSSSLLSAYGMTVIRLVPQKENAKEKALLTSVSKGHSHPTLLGRSPLGAVFGES